MYDVVLDELRDRKVRKYFRTSTCRATTYCTRTGGSNLFSYSCIIRQRCTICAGSTLYVYVYTCTAAVHVHVQYGTAVRSTHRFDSQIVAARVASRPSSGFDAEPVHSPARPRRPRCRRRARALPARRRLRARRRRLRPRVDAASASMVRAKSRDYYYEDTKAVLRTCTVYACSVKPCTFEGTEVMIL